MEFRTRMSRQVSYSLVTALAPQRVWDCLVDPANASRWVEGACEASRLDQGNLGRGSSLRFELEGRPCEVTISYWEPGKCFTFRMLRGPWRTSTSFRLEPEKGGTRLFLERSVDATGPWKLLLPFRVRRERIQVRRNLAQFGAILERHARSGEE